LVGKHDKEDEELLKLVGQPYTREISGLLKYGASIDSKGNVASVVTRTEMEQQRARCTFNKPWYKRWHLEDWEKVAIEVIALMVIIVIQMMALWTLDLSVAALLTGKQAGTGIMLTNGFVVNDPMQMYHIALYMITTTMVLLSGVSIFYALRLFKVKK
jgi:hypothetical protein